MSGSIGIVMAIGVSAILGWFLILGLLFSIQDLDRTLTSETGQPVTQIFLDTVGENGAIVLMVWCPPPPQFWMWLCCYSLHLLGWYRLLLLVPCIFVGKLCQVSPLSSVCRGSLIEEPKYNSLGSRLCRTFSITSNSRMMYAFARDGGIPGHRFFAKVDERWKSPIRTGNAFNSNPSRPLI